VGHYPFSHALEEIGAPHHEDVARPLITTGEVAEALLELAPDAPERVLALIRGTSNSPLQGLVSGSLDLDKIEYLRRDTLMCGVPYGTIDADRLINALTVVQDPQHGALRIGVLEKGLSALESLLFAKYQMYRNVYWHHAVRSATAMYKRLVEDALHRGAIEVRELSRLTDEALLHTLERRAPSALLDALRNRQLYKRAFECPAAELEGEIGEWIAADRPRAVATEDALAAECGLAPGELLLDYPEKTQMLGLDIPVVRRSGEVLTLTNAGLKGAIHLPQMSEQLYRSARWLRIFTVRPVALTAERVMAVVRGGGLG
jgi:HD superfamily phosphohydrolase